MKQQLIDLIKKALSSLIEQGIVPSETSPKIQVERARDKAHGDFACNLAMMLAKPCRKNPRELAQLVIDAMPECSFIEKVEIAGPGFINFYLANDQKTQVIVEVLKRQQDYGRLTVGENQRVLIEFVSANPTGPLHVGHGRGAAFGATLANLLSTAGFIVDKEYYVNDAGRQMDILAASVWVRYLESCGIQFDFPANGYKGEYVKSIAHLLQQIHGDSYSRRAEAISQGLPPDEAFEGDKEHYIDALITKMKELVGEEGFAIFHQAALDSVLNDIKEDLAEFGVEFEQWYSEKSLFDSGALDKGIDALKSRGLTYEKDHALWFKATEFGDEKDRVLKRGNGQTTYFASDVAYHWDKYERGYDRVIDVFGADHHGYVTRVKAAVSALGKDANAIDVLLVQFAILYRGKERVQMSTRSGSFVTLRELREEVGNDAARFFYVMRKAEQHMDFDLELAKSQSNDNPVYYIQYAHARICSVLRQLTEKSWYHDEEQGLANLSLLDGEQELQLIELLTRYPEVINSAAQHCEPHQVAYCLRELATAFHAYYNNQQFLVDDEKLRNARLCLIISVKVVINNGLTLLGVTSPEQM